ncbi:MAG TPA: hypothetical protein VF550_19050 [Polyangia bacterium]
MTNHPLGRLLVVAGIAASWVSSASPAVGGGDGPMEDGLCKWVFARYEPSEWEKQWYAGEWSGERSGHECQFLTSLEGLEKIDPDTLFASVPAALLPHYIYFNQGVDKAPEGRWNPWRILHGMGALADDYVVVKLDIDNPEIEDALVDQILKSPTLFGLIDEMYMERHAPTDYTKVTYRIFTEMRSKGIRMHAWP